MTWLRAQGYPLLKGVTAFWLSQLQQDAYTHDDMLVVNPCNSPEHGPTTFACTHYEQLLHQLFATILSRPTSLRLCRLPHQCLDHPGSARQRPAHLILGWCARMEAPGQPRLRLRKRHVPAPVEPAGLVPGHIALVTRAPVPQRLRQRQPFSAPSRPSCGAAGPATGRM
jgi:hypothetical protein